MKNEDCDCEDKTQCWEPCGDLGHDERYAKPADIPKKLIDTNPYLKDPEKRRKALIRSVASSTAIETGESIEEITKKLVDKSEKDVP